MVSNQTADTMFVMDTHLLDDDVDNCLYTSYQFIIGNYVTDGN